MIEKFEGQYRFLSNFWPCLIFYEGMVYKSVEHAYQAAKTVRFDERLFIRAAKTAGEAKKLGQCVTMRVDWADVRLQVMYELVMEKFMRNERLREMLVDTGEDVLVEGNWWGDTFWGVCRGKGENHLGKILMVVRHKLRQESLTNSRSTT